MDVPETRYATTEDGVHIAYQVLGKASTDLVFAPGFVFNVEHLWEGWPQQARGIRRLASFTRLIVFDRRGTGLSDHIVPGESKMTLEARIDDIRAVMDAAGSQRGWIKLAKFSRPDCSGVLVERKAPFAHRDDSPLKDEPFGQPSDSGWPLP